MKCKHDPYWTTCYGNCMACRAEKAEAELAALKSIVPDKNVVVPPYVDLWEMGPDLGRWGWTDFGLILLVVAAVLVFSWPFL